MLPMPPDYKRVGRIHTKRLSIFHRVTSILICTFQSVIDYLKIDIDKSEWGALQKAFLGRGLHKVKQLGLEAHNKRTDRRQSLARYLDILTQLETFGFRRWYTHANPLRYYQSEFAAAKILTSCHELVYININYLETSHILRAP